MLTIRRLLDRDEGSALIAVILISMLVGMLAAMTLTTGEQADWASARDRNHEVALGVTEAGVHRAIKEIESKVRTQYFAGPITVSGSTDEGGYTATLTRAGENFLVDAQGTVADGKRLKRARHVKVTLRPPKLFPDKGYALFSKTNLYLKNNNEIYAGDIWANDSLWVEANAIIDGSITSAQSWVRLEQHAAVAGYVWSGGRKCLTDNGATPPVCTSGWGINQTSGTIGQWAKSSVSAPNCAGENVNAYNVIIGGTVVGDLTSLGAKQGGGIVQGATNTGTCTSAQPRRDPPVFTFNKWNYDPATYLECPSPQCPGSGGAAAFNSWLNSGGHKNALEGTFAITECGTERINIQGAQLAGNVTVVANPVPCANGVKGARIWTDGVGDDALAGGEKAKFVLVSHYEPQVSTDPNSAEGFCTDKNDDYCAISAKNHFDPDCDVSFLVYADNGPVSMKNDTGNEDLCGSVIANGIHMKNGLQLTYSPTFERALGFGPTVYEIARWEELPVP